MISEILFFKFLSFCTKITHQERLLDDTIGRKQGGPPKTDDHTFFFVPSQKSDTVLKQE